jgi:hypothetical protein
VVAPIGTLGVVRRSPLFVSFLAWRPAQSVSEDVAGCCYEAVIDAVLRRRQQVYGFAAAAIIQRIRIPQYRHTFKLPSGV